MVIFYVLCKTSTKQYELRAVCITLFYYTNLLRDRKFGKINAKCVRLKDEKNDTSTIADMTHTTSAIFSEPLDH